MSEVYIASDLRYQDSPHVYLILADSQNEAWQRLYDILNKYYGPDHPDIGGWVDEFRFKHLEDYKEYVTDLLEEE